LFSRISFSSSLSLARRSISTRSIAIVLSSFSTPLRTSTCTSTTTPEYPVGNLNDESLTSAAFSEKIALNNFSSGVIGESPLGETLPTSISPCLTSDPI